MSTLLLPPHHCLRDPFHHETSLKSRKNPPRIHRSGDRRKRSPSYDSSDAGRDAGRSTTTTKMVVKSPSLVMGKVKILKRGEPIAAKIEEKLKLVNGDGDSDLFSRSRLGPEPEMIPKEVRLTDFRSIDVGDVEKFAGCGFVASPSPSLVPIPVFIPQVKAAKSLSLPKATEDIRRMLHL